MSSHPQRPASSQTLLGTLVAASLLACACGATPEQTGDEFGASGNEAGMGGRSVAGVGGFTNGSAGSVSAGGAFGVAGAFGTSGSPGTAGSFAAAGAFGTAGSVGFAGSGGSSTGASGSGSTGGVGGQGFGGPHGGSGGQAHGGTGGTGGSSVTFTELYTKYFNSSTYASNCTGGACHNPGTQRGIDFSTQAKGYTSVKNSLSGIISALSSGSMPRGRPKWSTADLALVKTWQAEGAPNN